MIGTSTNQAAPSITIDRALMERPSRTTSARTAHAGTDIAEERRTLSGRPVPFDALARISHRLQTSRRPDDRVELAGARRAGSGRHRRYGPVQQ
jgi:hypothetical protein